MDYRCGVSFVNAGSGMDATMTTIPCVFRCGWFLLIYIYIIYDYIYMTIYIYIYDYIYMTIYIYMCIPLGQHSSFPLWFRHWHSNCPKP